MPWAPRAGAEHGTGAGRVVAAALVALALVPAWLVRASRFTERARLRERTRIAQDIYDLLGHEPSLPALSAGALRLAPGLPGEHRAAGTSGPARARPWSGSAR
ncbi:hypothetical protein [Streptomyces sp. NPDC057686]|uniref:hypothetical protein n=1 Tax=Streptomyces sp. NPDC057686 TaxID=3346212 RepID=UPI0036BB1417